MGIRGMIWMSVVTSSMLAAACGDSGGGGGGMVSGPTAFGSIDLSTVNAGADHRSVDIRHDVKRSGILRRDHLGNRFEAVLLVAGIDPLGRITDGKVYSSL